ncbi:MAG: hypothetical protein ACREC6_04385, partial [Hyphomicrobiaceae bacterium]
MTRHEGAAFLYNSHIRHLAISAPSSDNEKVCALHMQSDWDGRVPMISIDLVLEQLQAVRVEARGRLPPRSEPAGALGRAINW